MVNLTQQESIKQLKKYAVLCRKLQKLNENNKPIPEKLRPVSGSFLEYLQHRKGETVYVSLQGANLEEMDLRRVNLQGINLRGVRLRGANLQGANLQRANLRGIRLQRASLQGTHLSGADLQRANLETANLQGANLQTANLESAYLRGINLQGADLQGADMQGTNLTNTVLLETKHLPQLSDEQRRHAVTSYNQLAERIIIEPRFSLLDHSIHTLYGNTSPETQEKLKTAFPRLQWDKPVEDQLKAAQTVYPNIQHVVRTMRGSKPKMTYDEWERIATSSAIEAGLSAVQASALFKYATEMVPGREPLNKDGIVRHILAENGMPTLRAKANQQEAAASFRKKFIQSSDRNNRSGNWVDKTGNVVHEKGNGWQRGE